MFLYMVDLKARSFFVPWKMAIGSDFTPARGFVLQDVIDILMEGENS